MGLLSHVVVFKSEPIGAVVALLVEIANPQYSLVLQRLKGVVDGAALYVGKNCRKVIQGLVEPFPAMVDVFALGDVMGQVLRITAALSPCSCAMAREKEWVWAGAGVA